MSGDPTDEAGTINAADSWECRNCGRQNTAENEDCRECGFVKGYDPEAKVDFDFSQVQETIQQQEQQRSKRLLYLIELTKVGLMLIIAVTFLMLFNRLNRDWPFMGVYERDANELAGAVLLIESRLTHSISKSDYDLLVSDALVEMSKFKMKYGESNSRHKMSFTKLIQVAEYYEIAGEAWDRQLLEESTSGRIDETALSDDVEESIQSLWHTASTNLLAALEDLR